jgi:hypothetical protein
MRDPIAEAIDFAALKLEGFLRTELSPQATGGRNIPKK